MYYFTVALGLHEREEKIKSSGGKARHWVSMSVAE
jgi:hypothetical protein